MVEDSERGLSQTNQVEESGCAESNRGYKTPSLAYYHYTTARNLTNTLNLWQKAASLAANQELAR